MISIISTSYVTIICILSYFFCEEINSKDMRAMVTFLPMKLYCLTNAFERFVCQFLLYLLLTPDSFAFFRLCHFVSIFFFVPFLLLVQKTLNMVLFMAQCVPVSNPIFALDIHTLHTYIRTHIQRRTFKLENK